MKRRALLAHSVRFVAVVSFSAIGLRLCEAARDQRHSHQRSHAVWRLLDPLRRRPLTTTSC